jgi:phospholipase/carboxylesterase
VVTDIGSGGTSRESTDPASPALDGPRSGPRAGGAAQQLVVICHGLGASGQDVIDLAYAWGRALPGAVFVAPDAPEPFPGTAFGRRWWDVGDRAPATMNAGVRRARTALDRFIDAELARLGLPPGAYALFGFSQGAQTALFTGLRRTVAPRGILAYSGALLDPESLAREMTHRPPVLLVHGEQDDIVPAARSHAAEAVLRAAGVPVETLYADYDHRLTPAGISLGALFLQRVFA